MKGVTDPESLARLAHLARLELEPDELARLGPELERVLEAFRVLERHEAGGTGARAAAPSAPTSAARPDRPAPSLAREVLLRDAPDTEDGFFRVPRTVGGPE